MIVDTPDAEKTQESGNKEQKGSEWRTAGLAVLFGIIANAIYNLFAELLHFSPVFYFFFTPEKLTNLSIKVGDEELKINSMSVSLLIVIITVIVAAIVVLAILAAKNRKSAGQKEEAARQKSLEKDLKKKEDKIAKLEAANDSYKAEKEALETKAQVLTGKLEEFQGWEQMLERVSAYISESEVVDSVQFFNMSEIPKADGLAPDADVTLSLSFRDGRCRDGANVNALHNAVYHFKGDVFHSLMKLLPRWRDYYHGGHVGKQSDPLTEKDIQNDAIQLTKIIREQLNQVTAESVNEFHYTHYRVFEILTTMILKDGVEIERLLQCQEGVEEKLKKGHRTGVLGAMLLDMTYIFSHENSEGKKSRVYFSAPLEYKKSNMIMTVALQSDKLRISPEHDIRKCCEEIYNKVKVAIEN